MTESIPSEKQESAGNTAPGRAQGSGDDMIDLPLDVQTWPFLNRVLGGCRDELVRLYRDADSSASRAQASHRWQAKVGLICATLAIFVAILELAAQAWHGESNAISTEVFERIEQGSTLLELGLVVVAGILFWIGKRNRKTWLEERNKAERCRLAKFRAMTRPSTWEGEATPGSCDPELVDDLGKIGTVSMKDWLEADKIPALPGRVRLALSDLSMLESFREYYLYKRLGFQRRHFENRSRFREGWWEELRREFPEILFIVSVVCVAVHAFSEEVWLLQSKADPNIEKPVSVLVIFVALAALLPTWGAGIHALRAAREGTRNVHRFRAKRVALEDLEHRLMKNEHIRTEEEAEELLRTVWCVEQIVESEHREWLRLMSFAEWAG